MKKRTAILRAVLVLCAVGICLLVFRPSVYVHPEFGRVVTRTAGDYPSVWRKARKNFLRLLGQHTGAGFLSILVGSAPLQWSAGGGPHHGFIYSNHPILNNAPLWEFALSTNTSLKDIRHSDVPSTYYGMNDPRGSTVFGTNWNGHAIRVPEGQIFFARLVTNRSEVFVVRIAEQKSGRKTEWMRAEYFRTLPELGAH